MLIKRILPLLMVLGLCFMPACREAEGESVVPSAQTDITGGYSELLQAYSQQKTDVTVTLTVDTVTYIENKFSLCEAESGYTLTDLTAEQTYTYDADTPKDEICRIAAYLPPYEVAYPSEDGAYSSRLGGEIALEMLLEGSNLFDGYSSENVSLDGECLYTAHADGRLVSYSYEFAVNISDGEAVFPAKIKYLIEVNK